MLMNVLCVNSCVFVLSVNFMIMMMAMVLIPYHLLKLVIFAVLSLVKTTVGTELK